MGGGQQDCEKDVLNTRTLRSVPAELESSKHPFSRGGAPLKAVTKMQVPRVRSTVPRWAPRVGGGYTLQQTAATGRQRERRLAPTTL